MNDPDHFKDPHKFDPNRFLNDQGEFVSSERVIPFGIGKRICLGQTLAEKEFYLFFAGIMQQFEMHKDPNSSLPSYNFDDACHKGVIRPSPSFTLLLKHRLKI
jgi:26-hydroxylase